MCRRIFQVIIGFLLLGSLTVSLLATVLSLNLLGPNFYKQVLAQSQVYDYLTAQVKDLASKEISQSISGTTVWQPVLDSISNTIAEDLKPDQIQVTAENNINNVWTYTTRVDSELRVYLPITQIRKLTEDLYDNTNAEVTKLVNTLPQCTSANTDFTTCIPEGVDKTNFLSSLPTILQSKDALFTVLTTRFPLLNADSESIPISEVYAELQLPAEQVSSINQSLSKARDYYDTYRLVMVIVWALNVALLLLFWLVSGPGFLARLRAFSFVWLFAAGVNLLAGIILLVLAPSVTAELLVTKNNFDPQTSGILTRLIQTISGDLALSLLITSGVIFVVVFVLWVLSSLFRPKQKHHKSKETPVETEPQATDVLIPAEPIV